MSIVACPFISTTTHTQIYTYSKKTGKSNGLENALSILDGLGAGVAMSQRGFPITLWCARVLRWAANMESHYMSTRC